MSDAYVYFIQADEAGPIKIGFTAGDPQARLNQLQTGNPSALKLLGAIKGTTAKERELHAALSEHRLQGEWFKPHPSVVSAIDAELSVPQSCGGFHCSFCGGCQHNTPVLISGPDDIYICANCVRVCAEIVGEEFLKKADQIGERAGAGETASCGA
jgi:hypothetical protein